MLENREGRPVGNEATQDLGEGIYPNSDTASGDDRETARRRFNRAYGVLVRGAADRRHVCLSLAAAERTVRRARARGHRAELIVVMMIPVNARHLDDLEDGEA